MAAKLQFYSLVETGAHHGFLEIPMRMPSVLALLATAALLSTAAGCASSAQAPKAPEPIAYDRADFTPPSEFDMSFAPQGVAQGPAIKRSQPTEGSYAPRLVSMERPGDH